MEWWIIVKSKIPSGKSEGVQVSGRRNIKTET
jgi:hypothetical protein